MVVGCSAMKNIQYVEVPKVKVEYVAKTDTTIIRDSIFISQMMKADTVFLTKEKYKYITKIKCDTLHRVDTLTQVKEVQVDVPYVPDRYKRTDRAFWVMLSIFLLYLLYRFYKMGIWVGKK